MNGQGRTVNSGGLPLYREGDSQEVDMVALMTLKRAHVLVCFTVESYSGSPPKEPKTRGSLRSETIVIGEAKLDDCPAQIEAPKLVRAAGCARHANHRSRRQNSFHTSIHFSDQLDFNLDLQHGFHRTPRRDWYAPIYRTLEVTKTQKLIAFANRLQSEQPRHVRPILDLAVNHRS